MPVLKPLELDLTPLTLEQDLAPLTLEPDLTPLPPVLGFTPLPPQQSDAISELEAEIATLEARAAQIESRNGELKEIIHSTYTSPNQKRALLEKIEWKHDISRRHACRLLNLARSTCWYRAASADRLPPKESKPIANLSQAGVITRLKKLSRQFKNGFTTEKNDLQTQFEQGLRRLGLPVAANLAQTNLNLSMDIFLAWCDRSGK